MKKTIQILSKFITSHLTVVCDRKQLIVENKLNESALAVAVHGYMKGYITMNGKFISYVFIIDVREIWKTEGKSKRILMWQEPNFENLVG